MFKGMLVAASCGVIASSFAADAPAMREILHRRGKFTIVGRTDCPEARAEVGKPVKIAVTVRSKEPGYFRADLYVNGNLQGAERIVPFGEFAEYSVVPETPGTVAAHVLLLDGDKRPIRDSRRKLINGGSGVFVSPEKLTPGNPEPPPDLDAFWESKRAELDKVPVREKRREVKMRGKHPELAGYDITVDCSGDAPVSGRLCMPRNARPKSLPAVVRFHGAGVRTADLHPEYGAAAISLDVNAHGIPNGRSKKFYDELAKTSLRDYRLRNWKDHKKNYYTGMLVRVMRALDYVKSLPEWDGKNLIVTGRSQGGAQALAAAALDRQVTLCRAEVPALCDLGARRQGRLPSGPLRSLSVAEQADPVLVREAAYLDLVFLAKHIKCPVYLSCGLVDNICQAMGIQVFYNHLPAGTVKDIEVHPMGTHNESRTAKGEQAILRALGIDAPAK